MRAATWPTHASHWADDEALLLGCFPVNDTSRGRSEQQHGNSRFAWALQAVCTCCCTRAASALGFKGPKQIEALSVPRPTMLSVQAKNLLMAIYFAADHVVWAGQAGIYTNKEALDRCTFLRGLVLGHMMFQQQLLLLLSSFHGTCFKCLLRSPSHDQACPALTCRGCHAWADLSAPSSCARWHKLSLWLAGSMYR